MKPIHVGCETCYAGPFEPCTKLDRFYDRNTDEPVKHFHKARKDRAKFNPTAMIYKYDGVDGVKPETRIKLADIYIKALEKERDELLASLPPLTQIASTA
jgi:hypothetical protein